MPRDANGTYTLPAGNPVTTGTIISSTWANNTLNDLASNMTDSLDRSGLGGMLAALRLDAGTVSAPGLGFVSETTLGIYRAGAADMRVVISATPYQRWTTANKTQFTVDGGANWRDPLLNANPITITGSGWHFASGLTIDAAGLVISAGGANITGGLTVDGNSFVTGTIASMTGNAGKLLTTNGTVNSWTNSLTGAAGAAGFTATGGSGNQNGLVGIASGTGNGVQGTSGSGANAGVAGVAQTAAGFGLFGQGVSGGVGVWASSSATNVDVFRSDGYINISGATNPSVTTGFANRITPTHVAKAWARITTNGAGSVSLVDGVNIASVSISTTTFTVNFASNMANTTYAYVGSVANGTTGAFFLPFSRAASNLTFRVMDGAAAGTALNPQAVALSADIVVYGAQ